MPKKNIIEVIIQGEDQASAILGKVGSAVSGLGSVAAGVATGGLALAAAAVVGLGAAAVGATVGITKLAFAAAEVEGTRKTFEKLGGDLKSLKEATRDMVSETDLMAASNKLMTMGIGETTEEVADLSEMATQLGLAMGEDATASMENFALMMANQSIPRLDSFGISSAAVRERIKELTATTEASGISQADWDKKVGKSNNRLTDLRNKLHLAGLKQAEWTDKTKESTKVAHAQRIDKITRQIAEETTALGELQGMTIGFTEASEAMSREEAFKIAVLEQGAIAMKKVGEQGESATATTLRWKAAIADLKLGIGQAFIPALEAIRGPVLDLVDKYGPRVIEWANVAGEWLAERIPEAIKKLEGAWVKYWPEAQKILTDFWIIIEPKLIWLKGFLFEDLPGAITKLRDLWLEYWPKAKTALTDFWEKIKPALEWLKGTFVDFYETYLPMLSTAWGILKGGWDEIVDTFNTHLKPALQELWGALQPLWDTLGIGETASDDIGVSIGAFAGFMTNLAASGIIESIKASIRGLTTVIRFLIAAYERGVHWGIRIRDVVHSMIGVFDRIQGKIDRVKDAFQRFKDTIAGFSLPWWLSPGSPTPLETGLTGIGEALAKVQGLAGGGLAFGGLTLAGAGAGAGGGVTTISIVNYFGPDSVRADEDILDIADAITQELELRGIGPVL